ncbi:S1C family serine protease [Maribacter sp. 2307ULW6-5]|uniref:S1C family serine protease n=1 Tax=Maribacter sp. 2307ULW6-5 TaxID=3386275 RepID=UPI0039BCCC80
MKKTLFIVTLLLGFIGNSQSLSELYKEVNSAVVIIDILSVKPIMKNNDQKLIAQSAQGSGILISDDGCIWTAAHVVQSAEVVRVEFLDGDVYEAEVLSSNPQADVAMIKIMDNFKLKNKKPVKIGNSNELQIGEDVFVVGAPLRLKQSLSKGILSGRHIPQSLGNGFVKIEFLQTDAAINSGNSGGPMFNMKGEVIGITSSIYSSSGGFNGIGFAASSNVAKKLLMDESNIWTGMESIAIAGNIARALNVPQESALLVLSLSSKGAANKLGLQGGSIPAIIDGTELLIGGDIILDFAGVKFQGNDFQELIREKYDAYNKGDKIPITVLRNGKIGTIVFKKE